MLGQAQSLAILTVSSSGLCRGEWAAMCAGGQPEVKGRRGFGSAMQALLRYLRSAVSEGAEAQGQAADAVSRPLSLEGVSQP